MSTGIGKTQQRILSGLELVGAEGIRALTVMDLAQRLGISDRQIRRAVHSLADRDLVVLTKEFAGWKGQGEYGKLVVRSSPGDKDVPTALVVKEGEPWPLPDSEGNYDHGWTAARDVEFIRNGMPTGASLFVWLPENRAKYLKRMAELWGNDLVEDLKAKEVRKVKSQPTQRN